MKKVHSKLRHVSSSYNKWHDHPLHSSAHLLILIVFSIFISGSMMEIIHQSFNYSISNITYTYAATNYDDTSGRLQKGGRFWFPYPYFGKPGTMNTTEFAKYFEGAYTHPRSWDTFNQYGIDLRQTDPSGVHMKHLNLRVTDDIDTNDIPDEVAIHTHDKNSTDANKWLIYDQTGKTLPVFGWGEAIDYKNAEYLSYVLNDWMPNKYFDTYINEISKPTFYVHDNGNFLGFTDHSKCMGGATSITNQTLYDKCMWYSKDDNARSAWKTMLTAFKNKYPNKKIFISSGSSPYDDYSSRMSTVKEIFAYADGYWSESINNDHVHWSNLSSSQVSNEMKRKALKITMDTADWLAKNDKYFFVNLGMASVTMGDGPTEPSQAEVDYAWAFFNLMRQGDKQFFSRVTKDSAGSWVPEVYDEMDNELGKPVELATQTSSNVWRRKFEKAIAYVNLSDSAVTITLPSGISYKNAREQAVPSSFTLQPFRGLTVYGESSAPSTPTPVTTPTTSVNMPVTNPVIGVGANSITLSNVKPSGSVSSEANIYLSFNTNESATCRYSKSPNVSYSEMWSFNLSQGKSHSLLLKSLPATDHRYYVKCMDTNGTKDSSDRIIAFTVNTPTVPNTNPVVNNPVVENNVPTMNVPVVNVPVVTETVESTNVINTNNTTTKNSTKSSGGSKSSNKSTKLSESNTLKNDYTSLKIGSQGDVVIKLQNILIESGYLVMPAGIAKGYYGPLTQMAHAKYLAKDTVGSKYQFSRNLTRGDMGPDVKALQQYLNNNGYVIAPSGIGSKGNETDYFGEFTRLALIKFQIAKGISPAVGFFGPLTRSYIK